MKPKVYIARPISQEVEEYIGEHCDYRKWEGEGRIPLDILMEEIKDVEGVLVQHAPVTDKLLEGAPNLKVISNSAVGYDSFDLEAMKRHKVLGTHTPFVLDETVADLVFSLVLATARRVPELNNFVKQGKWDKETESHDLFGIDVHHATMGIIGMGRIGEKIVRRARLGFEMDVLYNSRTPKPELEEKYGIVYSELETLLEKSDFVVLIVPLTPETHHLMGEKQFEKMKNSAIFINCARGAVVDERALIQALETGQIRGAGLDVFEQEPVSPDNPLLQMEQVVALPHIGSATEKTRAAMAMKAAENLVAGVTGKNPPDVVKELQELLEDPHRFSEKFNSK
ncbi:gluconate 2-dehydrogenase [Planomicrobium stackebrandtii]|uniref:Gluconate 2-dehydrogenase n=1 Tax=Planomicrobium stackebrandtii TaxID=253160 RepID=A0ABU0GVW8_9BACL|nr:D-glycerate dehydrogenase [Planomicrobium stackebrandtii]MDQ0429513.1 gluconate 2-dehydrogenase [Planomicrobium stackebrandtii]